MFANAAAPGSACENGWKEETYLRMAVCKYRIVSLLLWYCFHTLQEQFLPFLWLRSMWQLPHYKSPAKIAWFLAVNIKATKIRTGPSFQPSSPGQTYQPET
ncbi:hypothetical protein COCMIDRAFT_30865 [Bipolaris oryzae ATCC 44560]|uniref:Uncharacterized protein n=1 Tax=Bipolaris oryzae ATCC 44560 TaxID=930090 RepID=W6Z8W9_COCMI|nr:uncharacterized protein COCMIDRAFT_30865 [Bipolaris oryzae ATCC 44560]EUC40141.1 hypothetical protein COCMIDRAFT_30865 [Bipolaris oryzae ATCC 44560]